jgi:hypothetical protein
MHDFKGLVAFVQNLKGMLNDLPFLDFLEIMASFRQNHRGTGGNLGVG